MGEYLALEVPHYFQDSLRDYHEVEKVDLRLDEGLVVTVTVYEVTLGSGKKVYACEGGLPKFRANNVYEKPFPEPKTAAKFHLYTILKMVEAQNPDAKGIADEIAGEIELPQEYWHPKS